MSNPQVIALFSQLVKFKFPFREDLASMACSFLTPDAPSTVLMLYTVVGNTKSVYRLVLQALGTSQDG